MDTLHVSLFSFSQSSKTVATGISQKLRFLQSFAAKEPKVVAKVETKPNLTDVFNDNSKMAVGRALCKCRTHRDITDPAHVRNQDGNWHLDSYPSGPLPIPESYSIKHS